LYLLLRPKREAFGMCRLTACNHTLGACIAQYWIWLFASKCIKHNILLYHERWLGKIKLPGDRIKLQPVILPIPIPVFKNLANPLDTKFGQRD
jgi:hypothetical protein